MNVLGAFAKHWAPGSVKTRLAATIGNDAASRLYRGFVHRTLQRFSHVGDRRVLAYSPPEQAEAFAPFEPWGWRLAPQAPGDLGRRMQRFFEETLEAGAQRVVLIGSDSPTLPIEYVEKAFAQLETHAAVLGPTSDGGYYLVGVAGRTPPIFEGIPWSTADVWPRTIERLEESRTPFAVLPEWYDVDEASDLRRLDRELSLLAKQDAAWRPLKDEVRRLVDSVL